MRSPDGVYYLHADHLGSTSLTTDDGGGVVARQLYHPYGTVRWSEGTLPTDFGFTGQRHDAYIKLTQMGARWYDPQLGRWISADTIVPSPANPQTLNRYSYVNNQPLVYTDPTGHYAALEDNDNSLEDGWYGCIYPQGHEKAGRPIYWTEEQKAQVVRNRAVATTVGTIALAFLWEPADWAMTFNEWRQGHFSPLDLLGLLPILSTRMDDVGDALHFAGKAGVDEASDTLLRHIHPNDILDDGTVMSRAFKDPEMSVFRTSKGATPQAVIDALDYGRGGKVAALDLAEVLKVPGVEGIINEVDPTLAKLGDAHAKVLNRGSKGVAKKLRNLATIVFE